MVSYPTADGDHRVLPARRAFAAGAAAWILGYVTTVALVLLEGGTEHAPSLGDVGSLPGTLRAVGIVFLEAQFLTTEVRIGEHSGSIRLLPQVARTVPEYAFHLAPAVAIVAAAAVFVRAAPFRPASPEAGAALGASVVVGYLPLTLVALSVCTLTTGEVTFSSELGPRLVFPGVVYPTTAGTIGGAIAWRGGERAG